MSDGDYKLQTKLVHLGRDPDAYHGVVNPPIIRTSTILYETLDAYTNPNTLYRYGRMGNPLSCAFEEAIAELEGGYKAVSTGSGLSAVSLSLLSFLSAGDHVLVVDSNYPPMRGFCDQTLSRYGIDVEYYDPMIDAGIADLVRDNTAVIYMESPGSATFEIQDVPAIVAVAKAHDIVTILDNSWASAYLYHPLAFGVDVSLMSCTKYIGGHGDINLGVVSAADEAVYAKLKRTALDMGLCAGMEDLYNGLRGLRSLEVRMKKNAQNMAAIVEFLQERDEVQKIYYPALPDHAGHDIWKRDFKGVNGVASFLLRPCSKAALHNFVDSLQLFPIGSSWGGYESLLQPQYMKNCRSAVPWSGDIESEGMLLRLQVGLEDVSDLIADLEQGFLNFS